MPLFSGSNRGSLFSRIGSGLGKVIGVIQKGAGSVADVASKAQNILGKVSDVARNPIVSSVADKLGVGGVVSKVADIAGKGSNLAGNISGVSQKVADITSPATYHGQNPVPALRNAVERAKDIVRDVRIGGNPATWSPFPAIPMTMR